MESPVQVRQGDEYRIRNVINKLTSQNLCSYTINNNIAIIIVIVIVIIIIAILYFKRFKRQKNLTMKN